jgi:type I restriction enzyme M protein
MFRRITIERPLRLRYEINEDAIDRLQASKAYENLIKPRANTKDPKQAIERGEAAQVAVVNGLGALSGFASQEKGEAETKIREVLQAVETPTTALRNAILKATSVRDSEAPIVLDGKGDFKPDPDLRDYEHVPLSETVAEFMEREVLPYVADAWVDESKERIGTEIPLTRLFYRYQPPRSLAEIDVEIRDLESKIQHLTQHVAG